MITEFVKCFMDKKRILEQRFARKHPEDYLEIVRGVVSLFDMDEGDEADTPDPNRIYEIDDGECQGTLVFVIGDKSYHPHNYWYVKIGYGSCSGCDTLIGIRGYSNKKPTQEEVGEYMILALHIVQAFKKMD